MAFSKFTINLPHHTKIMSQAVAYLTITKDISLIRASSIIYIVGIIFPRSRRSERSKKKKKSKGSRRRRRSKRSKRRSKRSKVGLQTLQLLNFIMLCVAHLTVLNLSIPGNQLEFMYE